MWYKFNIEDDVVFINKKDSSFQFFHFSWKTSGENKECEMYCDNVNNKEKDYLTV